MYVVPYPQTWYAGYYGYGYNPYWDPFFRFWWFGPYAWDGPWHYWNYMDTQTTVAVYTLESPTGFDRAVATLFRSGAGRTVRVELERKTSDGVELTILRDDNAGARVWLRSSQRLDDAVVVPGKSRDDAILEYVLSRGYAYHVSPRQFQSLYEGMNLERRNDSRGLDKTSIYARVYASATYDHVWR